MKTVLKTLLMLSLNIAIVIVSAACSSAKDESGVGDRDPANDVIPYDVEARGKINGEPWSFKQGSAEVVDRNGKPYLFIRLWNQTVADPCNTFSASDLDVRILVPHIIGRYKIRTENLNSDDPAVIFGDQRNPGQPENNIIASRGLVEILEVDGRITGGLTASFTAPIVGETEVAGSFDVELCAP